MSVSIGHKATLVMKTAMISCVILIVFVAMSSAQSDVVSEYIKALSDGDLGRAKSFWLEDIIAASGRLEITYKDIPAKFDCVSLVVQKLDDIRSGKAKVMVGMPEEHDGYYIVPVTLIYNLSKESCNYYVVPHFGKWRLADRSYIFARGWPALGTKYVDLYIGDSTLINNHALKELDDFIEHAAKQLGISDIRLEQLKEQRVVYYICNEDQIEALTGFKTEGMYDLAVDHVFSQHLPHKHELVHFLVNYRLQNLPLYTLPLLQEGLAVALGGRWGKSPEVVMQLGDILLKNEFVDINSLLTFDGFYLGTNSAEMSYPVAGLLADLIISEHGMDKFLALYRLVSDNQNRVMAMNGDDFKLNKIPAVLGISYDELMTAFNKYRERYMSVGMRPGADIINDKNTLHFNGQGWNLDIATDGGDYSIHYDGPDGATCRIFLAEKNNPAEKTYQSWMFAEQNPGAQYHGERFGIVFNGDEAGLYDFYLNCLLAKYVYGFAPDSSYKSGAGSGIAFRFDRALLPGTLGDYEISVHAR